MTFFLRLRYVVPMTRIERVTSPLPRECSTTELHGRNFAGAGEGNRTLVISLEGFCSTIELHPPDSFTLLLENRLDTSDQIVPPCAFIAGGGGWIRTNVGARPTDLQSAPVSLSGTPLAEPEIMC